MTSSNDYHGQELLFNRNSLELDRITLSAPSIENLPRDDQVMCKACGFVCQIQAFILLT